MSELEELENRLIAAMDRLEAGINRVETGHDSGTAQVEELEQLRAENAALQQDLAAKDAQLTQQAQAVLEQDARLTRQNEKLAALDADLQRLRTLNEKLLQNNAALRKACETGQVEAALLNTAQATELEALRAQRAVEKAEAEAAMASIDVLVQSAGKDV